jgi:SAM-dependent methyltransferase
VSEPIAAVIHGSVCRPPAELLISAAVYDDRVYSDAGNPRVVELIDRDLVDVLDVGCGSGDTAALLRARDPHKRIDGITASRAEAERAASRLDHCWVANVEEALPQALTERRYDVLVLSHVLEHMREPERVVARFAALLRPGGVCVIALPNVMVYRQRWQFLRGRFDYQAQGLMDETHLRFYSYDSAPRVLSQTPELSIVHRDVTGSAPLWRARRMLRPPMAAAIDALACRSWPNLFGAELLLKCRKQPVTPV